MDPAETFGAARRAVMYSEPVSQVGSPRPPAWIASPARSVKSRGARSGARRPAAGSASPVASMWRVEAPLLSPRAEPDAPSALFRGVFGSPRPMRFSFDAGAAVLRSWRPEHHPRSMVAMAAVAPSPMAEVAASSALATIADYAVPWARPGEGGGHGGTASVPPLPYARKRPHTSLHLDDSAAASMQAADTSSACTAVPAAAVLGGAMLPSAFRAHCCEAPSGGGGSSGHVSGAPVPVACFATLVEVGATSPACELTSQQLVATAPGPRVAEAAAKRLRLCVAPLEGRAPDATGRVPVRAGVMEAPASEATAPGRLPPLGRGGERARGTERQRFVDAALLGDTPLVRWQDRHTGAAEEVDEFGAVCARVAAQQRGDGVAFV